VRAFQEEAGRALCLIRIESRTFIVGFRHGSLSYGLARSDGSDRFIELYHAVAIAEAGRTARQRARTGAPRPAHGCAPLAAHPHLALQASRHGPVAQGIEQQPSKLKVAGSNPAGVANEQKRY
jgi:hypothetical protein